MKVLPDSVPLVRIQRFLHTSLQNMLAERRKAQMLKGLLYAEHLQVLFLIILSTLTQTKFLEFAEEKKKNNNNGKKCGFVVF